MSAYDFKFAEITELNIRTIGTGAFNYANSKFYDHENSQTEAKKTFSTFPFKKRRTFTDFH
jgi:hypothetical protein